MNNYVDDVLQLQKILKNKYFPEEPKLEKLDSKSSLYLTYLSILEACMDDVTKDPLDILYCYLLKTTYIKSQCKNSKTQLLYFSSESLILDAIEIVERLRL